MLAGRAPFARDTITDTLAALVERDPDWQALPAATPAKIRDLLRRCLQKDPQRRLRDIGDAYLDVDDAIAGPAAIANVAIAVHRRPIAPSVVATAILASGITASILLFARQPPEVPGPDLVLTIAPPGASGIVPVGPLPSQHRGFPRMVPSSRTFDRSRTLQLRRLNSIAPEPLRVPIGTLVVVWSPDSKSLLFQDGDNLKRIQVPDGAPEIIGRLPAAGTRLVTVSDSGAMLFSCCQTRDIFSLLFVHEVGAQATEIRVPGLKAGSYGNAVSLPGGEDFLIEFVPQGSRGE